MRLHRQLIRAAKVSLDLTVLAGAYSLAFLIRFEGSLSGDLYGLMVSSLPYVMFVKLLCCMGFGVRRLTWRYVSLLEAKRLVSSLVLASLLLLAWRLLAPALGPGFSPRSQQLPLGVLLIDLPLSLLGIVGLRVAWRVWVERLERARRDCHPAAKVPSVILGAGRAAALVAKELAAGRGSTIRPLGFLDDNLNQVGHDIHGIPVLGTLDQLRAIVQTYGAGQALIALDDATGPTLRRLVGLCGNCGITAKIIPELRGLVEGKINLSTIREVAIEDLLRREPVRLDISAVSAVVGGRRVLITGAGGSIGSELGRVVCRFNPAVLILVEQSENGLFHIHRELEASFPKVSLVPCVANIGDIPRMQDIFTRRQPAVVFHAAAHKHVPLMQWNPGEAVKNNVVGTKNLADVAHAAGVGVFVMISTDKAVKPASVMGVSKRVAELYIQGLSQRSVTRFVTVRFGNVLGSTGSVIPIFKEQIARGGPVTVTHPDMKRYFMTVSEACQLVLQAASMGQGGELFILEMGEPVKIVDLARDLIRLSGLQPETDIPIAYTGIRPGEKLMEELALQEEGAEKTHHPRIFIGRLKPHNWQEINRHIRDLHELAASMTVSKIHEKFKEIVPEYEYSILRTDGHDNHVRPDAVHEVLVPTRNGSRPASDFDPTVAASGDELI